MMFGAIRRVSDSYHEERGEKEKGVVKERSRGYPLSQVQFPVDRVMREPLSSKADWMRGNEVLR